MGREKGWHFFTGLVQLKFLKDSIKYFSNIEYNNLDELKLKYNQLKNSIHDHIDKNNTIISSFDENGNIIKYDDAATLLAYCHINYDNEILSHFPIELVENNCNNLINAFRKI